MKHLYPLSHDDDAVSAFKELSSDVEANNALEYLNQVDSQEIDPNVSTAPAQNVSRETNSNDDRINEAFDDAPEGAPEGDGDETGLISSVVGDVFGGAAEGAPQILKGGLAAIDEVSKLLESNISGPTGGIQITNPETGELDIRLLSAEERSAINEKFDGFGDLNTVIDDADTVTGSFLKSTSQFLVGFLPAAKGLKAVGLAGKTTAGTIGSATAAGAIADAAVFDPYEDRLSTYLNTVPALSGIVPDYLADNDPENQTEWEGRLKNAIEGAGLGLVADGLLTAFKAYKRARADNGGDKKVPTSSVEMEVRDKLREGAQDDIVQDISDADLDSLGDPDAEEFFIKGDDGDETFQLAKKRLIEASESNVSTENKALEHINKINEISEQLSRDLPDDVSPMHEALDLARQGKNGTEKLEKQFGKAPAATEIKRIGGVDPKSPLASELKARGISNKTHPGLFKKGGVTALDNLVRSEHPIFSQGESLEIGGNYISQDEWIDAIVSETDGVPFRSQDQINELADADLVGDLPRELEELGIDINELSNDEIVARIKQIDDEAKARANSELEVPENAQGIDLDDTLNQSELIDEADFSAQQARPAEVNPTGKVFINHARIKEPGDVKNMLQQLADADAENINAKRGGEHVTNAEQINASHKEFNDLKDLIGRDPGPMSAPQAIAARKILNASAEQLVNLAKKAVSNTASNADLYNFRRSMIVHYAIQAEVIAARTETARALQSWSIFTGSSKKARNAVCAI